MEQTFRLSMWNMACQSAQSHALLMSQNCSVTAKELIAAVVQRFCEQAPPATQDELSLRHMQSISVSMLIGSVCHGESMARNCPEGAAEIFGEVRELPQRPLPRSQRETGELSNAAILTSGKISSICHKYGSSEKI